MFKLSEVPSIRTQPHTHDLRLCVRADVIFLKTEVSAIINTDGKQIIYISIINSFNIMRHLLEALRHLNIPLMIAHRFHYNLTESRGTPIRVLSQ